MTLTEHTVVQAILHTNNRFARHLCVPRYTPARWFEMDVAEITDAGMMREYEVKLTRADFRADAHKGGEGEERKHARLSLADPNGPGRFWYVVPFGLNVRDLLPDWAGLIEVRPFRGAAMWMHMTETVKAPILHRQPVDAGLLAHLHKTFYWRYHRLLAKQGAQPVEVSEEENAPAQVNR